jgi:hypothetical protein
MDKFKDGFILKARKIEHSKISKAPPHIREIWDLLLRKANWKDHGSLKKGQLLITYNDIIEDLSWYVGWRKHTYSRHQCEYALKRLRSATMIATRKTVRGLVITILNYCVYQDPENYKQLTSATRKDTGVPQTCHTIRKEGKKEKKGPKEKINKKESPPRSLSKKSKIPKDFKITDKMFEWFSQQNFQHIEIQTATSEFIDYWLSEGKTKVNWVATWRNGMRNKEKWAKNDNKNNKFQTLPDGTPAPRTYYQCQDYEKRQLVDAIKRQRMEDKNEIATQDSIKQIN